MVARVSLKGSLRLEPVDKTLENELLIRIFSYIPERYPKLEGLNGINFQSSNEQSNNNR